MKVPSVIYEKSISIKYQTIKYKNWEQRGLLKEKNSNVYNPKWKNKKEILASQGM